MKASRAAARQAVAAESAAQQIADLHTQINAQTAQINALIEEQKKSYALLVELLAQRDAQPAPKAK